MVSVRTQKTWTSPSTFTEVSPNTIAPYTSKSPRRIDVSILTITLGAYFKLAIFSKQELKRTLLYIIYVLRNLIL